MQLGADCLELMVFHVSLDPMHAETFTCPFEGNFNRFLLRWAWQEKPSALYAFLRSRRLEEDRPCLRRAFRWNLGRFDIATPWLRCRQRSFHFSRVFLRTCHPSITPCSLWAAWNGGRWLSRKACIKRKGGRKSWNGSPSTDEMIFQFEYVERCWV